MNGHLVLLEVNVTLSRTFVASIGSVLDCIEPVSYTHLDVYKRQAQLQFVLLGRNAAKRVGAPEYDAYNVLSQEDREVAQLYKVPSIPSALMIRKDGRIGSQLAVGHAAIEQLIKSIAA